MKHKHIFFIPVGFYRTVILTIAVFVAYLKFASAQVQVPFTQRTSQYSPTKTIYNIKGDFQMIGNTNLTLVNYGINTNNDNKMKFVDLDGISSTTNSSSATLTLSTENGAIPSCSNIIFAGLYWTGRTANNVTTEAKRSIKLKGPDQADYQSFMANINDIRYPGDNNMYVAYTEVTDLVRSNGVGEYWIADMALTTGSEGPLGSVGYYGGWGMVVIYENSNMNWRDVTIFDGYAFVRGSNSYELPVSGFKTVQTGNVNMKLGLMAGEGDKGDAGDYFQIRDYTNTSWISLSHPGNDTSNFFNSSIFTGGNARNPDLVNNTGIDISMFNIPNPGNTVITNNQTSISFKYGTPIDQYNIFSFAMSVDAYVPFTEGIATVLNIGGIPPDSTITALPGEEIEFALAIKNKGTEAINNTRIVIPIPYASTFDTCWNVINFSPEPTPNNLYFDNSLGATGSIVWDLGTLPLPADPNDILASLRIKLKVTDDCFILSNPNCIPSISFNGTMSGTGAISNTSFSGTGFVQGYEYTGICIGEPIKVPIQVRIDADAYVAQYCQGVPQTKEFIFCNNGVAIPITEVSGAFPAGSRFFNDYPVTPNTAEFTINNPFPAIPGISTYYAIPPAVEACYFVFTINIKDTVAPVIADLPAESIIDCPDVPVFAVASVTDACGSDITLDFKDVTLPGACVGSYKTTRTWIAKDISGNESTASQTITVQDITAPILTVPADVTSECSAVPEAGIATATDNCDTSVTVAYVGEVRTNGTCDGSYTLTRTWKAVDNCLNESTSSQVITVQDTTAPVLTVPADVTSECSAVPEAGIATATDNCDAYVTVMYVGEVRTNGTCAGSYTLTRTWTATDGCGNGSTASQTINVQDNTAPVIAALPAATTIYCPATPEFAVASATEACGSIISLDYVDVTTPGTCIGNYSITRSWIATDGCGNSTNASQTINVKDNTAPVISELPGTTTINCPATPEFASPTAIDYCGSNFTFTYNDVTSPGLCAASYSITRTWTATDACGNISTSSQIINVQDLTAPVVNCSGNISVNVEPGVCGATVIVPQPTVIENCSSSIITNSINQTGDASGVYPVGTTTIEWTVADECGNISTCSMTVTVTDTEAPVIICPANISICSIEQVILGTAVATDNCEGEIKIANNAPSTFETGTTEVVWTATDIHGNVSTCTQTVTLSMPVIANAGNDIPLCAAMPHTFTEASASNYSSVSWTHNGKGTLSDATVLNPTYTPTAGESGAIEFNLSAYGTSGCGDMVASDQVILSIYPAIIVNSGNDEVISSGTATTLYGSVTGGSGVFSYTWTPEVYIVNNYRLDPTTSPLSSETIFTLTATDAISGCSESDNVTISMDATVRPIARNDYDSTDMNIPTIVNVTNNDTDVIGLGLDVTITSDPAHGTAELDENGFITYTPEKNYIGIDTLTYQICDRGTPSKCASAQFIITISSIRSEIEVYNLVTPDDDGKNDYWHIEGINIFPDNEVIIFNRWGNKIIAFDSYNNSDNRWDGMNNKNEYLPDGVYFYSIKIKDKQTLTGWVYVRGSGSN